MQRHQRSRVGRAQQRSNAAHVSALEPRRLLAGNVVFNDDFNLAAGQQPSGQTWTLGNQGTDPNNANVQYTNSATTLGVVNDAGALDGKALAMSLYRDPANSSKFLSAKISAKIDPVGGNLLYGHVEARIRIPGGPNGQGDGIWPAFWMLGNNIGSVGWPNCGEIDIMENKGSAPGTISGTLHGPGYSGGNGIGAKYTLPSGQAFYSAYHTFAADWGPNYVNLSVDGNVYAKRTPADLPAGTTWAYNHPFYVILDVCDGGLFAGPTSANSTFPQTMLVDYVRSWSLNPIGVGAGAPLPTGWSDTDIGSPVISGVANTDGTTWTVAGAGNDIWNAADQFHFASQALTGNGTIVAKVTSMWNAADYAKAGVMIRDGTGASAAYALACVLPNHGKAGEGANFEYRTTAGANAQQAASAAGITNPQWLKLVRSGDVFTAYYSSDGTTWAQDGAARTIPMSSTVRIGLAVDSNDPQALNAATFTDVAVAQSPATLSITAPSGFGTHLAWTASPGADGYTLERSTAGGAFAPIATLAGGATTYDDVSLTPDTLYAYRLTARKAAASAPFVSTSAYTLMAGDANGDGVVTFADFVALSNHFGGAPGANPWAAGDFNDDGKIDFADFVLLSNNFGKVQAAHITSAGRATVSAARVRDGR